MPRGGGVRVLLVEDHRLLREGLARTLEDSGFRVVGGTAEATEALSLAEQLEPDVILVDTSIAGDGSATLGELHDRAPGSRVVLLAAEQDPRLIEGAREAGAAGYVLKDASSQEVVAALARAAVGGRFVRAGFGDGPQTAADDEPAPRDPSAVPELTAREREILQLLAEGLSPTEVAERLSISHKTVRNHLSNAYESLDVSSRSQAVVRALRHGLIELPT